MGDGATVASGVMAGVPVVSEVESAEGVSAGVAAGVSVASGVVSAVALCVAAAEGVPPGVTDLEGERVTEGVRVVEPV